VQALLIQLDGQVIAMPLSAVDEVMSPRDVKLDTVDGAPVIVLRDGEVVPLQSLESLLDASQYQYTMPEDDDHIILIDAGGQPRALFVRKLVGRDEVVIKPLSRLFRGVKGFGGATILGDGRVALILDPRTVFPTREEGP
jgi:two-component system chemotaxis sensor kinase CheA